MSRHRLIDPRNTVRIQLKPEPCCLVCMSVLALAFFAFVLSNSTAYPRAMGLTWSQIPHQPWRILTSLLWFGPVGKVELFQVLGALAAIWALGSPMERWWGGLRLGLLMLATGLLGNLAAAALSALWWNDLPVGGPGASGVGLATATATVFYRSWFVLPKRSPSGAVWGLSARHMAIFLASVMALSVLVDIIEDRSLARYGGYLVSGTVAFLLVTEGWRPWVIWRRKRLKRLAATDNVVLFPDRNPRSKDPKHWN